VGEAGRDRRGNTAGHDLGGSGQVAELEREVRELRRANQILKSAASFFAAELDRPSRRLVCLRLAEASASEQGTPVEVEVVMPLASASANVTSPVRPGIARRRR